MRNMTKRVTKAAEIRRRAVVGDATRAEMRFLVEMQHALMRDAPVGSVAYEHARAETWCAFSRFLKGEF